MSKVALLIFNPDTGKFEARFNNVMLCQSQSKGRVRDLIENGSCAKAISYGVTEVSEAPASIGSRVTAAVTKAVKETSPVEEVSQYSINERFEFLANFTDMVIDGTIPSLLVTGGAGLGKTTTVISRFDARGLIDARTFLENDPQADITGKGDYMVIKGYSTARGLYNTLYANRNKLCVFDDCDKVLKDPVAVNVLKSALDSSGKRFISWNSQRPPGDDIPSTFEFKGGAIFISNLTLEEMDDAVRSRCLPVDLAMSTEEKLERIEHVMEGMLTFITIEKRRDALEFLRANAHKCADLNFRTFISVAKIRNTNMANWQRQAEYTISAMTPKAIKS